MEGAGERKRSGEKKETEEGRGGGEKEESPDELESEGVGRARLSSGSETRNNNAENL